MKTNLRTAALAAPAALAVSLGLALPTGAEPVKAKEQVTPMLDATVSLLRELQQASDPQLPLRAAFERVEAFRPTPATAGKLRAAFGTEHPYLFARQPDKAGRPAWRATLLPLHFQSDTGASVDSDAAIAELTLDKSGNGLDIEGSWPRFSVSDRTASMTISGMTLKGRQQRGYGGVWYGGGEFDVASMRFDGAGGAPGAEISDLRTALRTTEHAKTADIAYDARIGAIAAAGERIEDAHVGIRIVNIDKKALAELKAASDRQPTQPAPAAPPTPEQRLDAMKPLLRAFGQSALADGTALEIDDISARFHGHKASIRGRVALAGAGAHAGDAGDFTALARRIVARFEVKVPLVIVRDVAGIVAARQAVAQPAQAATQAPPPQSNAPMGQTIADVIVGKLVGGGFAKVEDDALVSTIEWRDGRLSANGKPVALPAAPQPPVSNVSNAPPIAFSETVSTDASVDTPAAPLPQDMLRARLVAGSCRMPDYPDDVVRANQPLFLSLSYRVDTEGKVRDVAVPSHTAFPDWDRAVEAALAGCTYIPALRDGQPAELQMFWTIRRAPGSRSPQ